MSKLTLTPLITAAAALSLSGCAGDAGRYPSLAVRDAERAVGLSLPRSLLTRQRLLRRTGRASAARLSRPGCRMKGFLQAFLVALSLARSAAGTGNASDVRARALIAIAAQTSLRGQTALALADLDKLEAQNAVQLGSLDEIRTARSYVESLVSEQDAALDTLSQAFGQ